MRTLLALAILAASGSAFAQTVSNDGSLSFSYPFPLPPARGKYQPVLALTYSSSNTRATAYGAGWSLSTNYIDASMQATYYLSGTPRTRYTLVSNGGSRLLVCVAGPCATSVVTSGGDGTPDGTYRADVAQSYLVLTKAANTWTAVDSVGNAFTYSCQGATSCRRWYLTSVQDPDGNATYYDYVTEPGSCASGVSSTTALLTGIRYDFGVGSGSTTPVHQVKLTYGPSSPEIQAINGCLVTHNQLLTGVSLFRATAPNQTVSCSTAPYTGCLGSWTLTYSVSRDTSRERLDSIKAFDRSNGALGIPTTFSYETNLSSSNAIQPFDSGLAITFSSGSDPALTTFSAAQCGAWGAPYNCSVSDVAALIDIDGDGLPDLVWGGADSSNPGIRWARNMSRQGGGGTPTFSTVTLIPGSATWQGNINASNGDGTVTTRSAATASNSKHGPVVAPVNGQTTSLGLGGTITNTLLMDMNGDGTLDLISAPANGITCPLGVQYYSAQTGQYSPPTCYDISAPLAMFNSLFHTQATYLPLAYSASGERAAGGSPVPTNTWVQLTDFTGDGVPDFIIADPNSATWYVYPGLECIS